MSEIGLTGVSTTTLNKVGPNGEVLPGSAFPGLDAFGGSGPKVGINEAGDGFRNLNFDDLSGQLRTASKSLEGLISGLFGSRQRSDLKYPLETDNPAYQARVQFRMFSLQPSIDGESQKNFDKVASDNLKSLLESSAKTQDVRAQVDSFGYAGRNSGTANAGIDGPSAAAASATGSSAATGANKTSLTKIVSDFAKSGKDKVAGSRFVKQTSKHLMGGVEFKPVRNTPIVDMYFPVTMQFNDNAQYDNASLGAFGGAVEGAMNQGGGALESILGEFNNGLVSMFDAVRGNQKLSEAAFRVGLARVIDKGSMINSGVANALTLQNRTIINPNIRALFRGVGLREFTFQFKMIARSQLEAEVIRQIVQHFREEMYPGIHEIAELGGADIGFKFPNVFQIQFNYNGVLNRNIPKLEFCYLRNVSTSINPTGGAFRRDGQPNEVDLTLSFVEYKTLTKTDIKAGY